MTLSGQLINWAKASHSHLNILCVVAVRELENWFVAAAESLSNKVGFPVGLVRPTDPEGTNAENWIKQYRPYKKATDAVTLAQQVDLTQCRTHSPSFRRLCKLLDPLRSRIADNWLSGD